MNNLKLQSKILTFILCLTFALSAISQKQVDSKTSLVWNPLNGDDTYTNPIIHADYSDPDVIRVDSDYYLVSSSFNEVPGLPILHSKDLVNWRLIGHAFEKQQPYEWYNKVKHGGGVWAPSIRYHNKEFYIYYPDPDIGIYMTKAAKITGPWTEPLLIKNAKGWIDPCPIWDDNGNAYLINGMAASRAGINSVLILSKMSQDGSKLLDDGVMVFDGHKDHPIIEGPKIYKRKGYYYILAPAGGVGKGWELALRSKNIYGPYEEKIVLEQGKTSTTNGPHQGGWVETQTGESWFLHFQDKDAYGRILHLEPVKWVDGWPLMGIDDDGNGIGNPVSKYKLPNVGKNVSKETMNPQESDEFNGDSIGLQWQWPANRQSNFCFPAGSSYGFLRLRNIPMPDSAKNVWDMPNVLSQKFPAPNFTVTTKCTFTPRTEGEETGLIITGIDYAYISAISKGKGLSIAFSKCIDAEKGNQEIKTTVSDITTNTLYFRVSVSNVDPTDKDSALYNTSENSKYGNAKCVFSYSIDGVDFKTVGEPFAAKKGKWIGSKVGIFATRKGTTYHYGYADYDWFRISE